jgi:hypothetical protein
LNDRELVRLLSAIDPRGRDVLRRAMRAEQFERDELAAALAKKRTAASRDAAELLDLASLDADSRRQIAGVLGELEATP